MYQNNIFQFWKLQYDSGFIKGISDNIFIFNSSWRQEFHLTFASAAAVQCTWYQFWSEETTKYQWRFFLTMKYTGLMLPVYKTDQGQFLVQNSHRNNEGADTPLCLIIKSETAQHLHVIYRRTSIPISIQTYGVWHLRRMFSVLFKSPASHHRVSVHRLLAAAAGLGTSETRYFEPRHYWIFNHENSDIWPTTFILNMLY